MLIARAGLLPATPPFTLCQQIHEYERIGHRGVGALSEVGRHRVSGVAEDDDAFARPAVDQQVAQLSVYGSGPVGRRAHQGHHRVAERTPRSDPRSQAVFPDVATLADGNGAEHIRAIARKRKRAGTAAVGSPELADAIAIRHRALQIGRASWRERMAIAL